MGVIWEAAGDLVGWKVPSNGPVPRLFLGAMLVVSSNGSMPPSGFKSISGNFA